MLKDIIERKTIRNYKSDAVNKTMLEQIIRAGMHAPFASREVPFHCIVCSDKKTLSDLKNIHPYGQALETAPVAIVLCADIDLEPIKGVYITDCAAATENILLAAKNFDLGSCWIGLYPWDKIVDDVKLYFSLPENIIPFCIITIGYPNEKKESVDRFDKSKVHYDCWE